MWDLTKKIAKHCEDTRDELERNSGGSEMASARVLGTVLSRLPEFAREHVRACDDCRTYAEEIVQAAAIFESGKFVSAEAEPALGPSPYFISRVMRTILDREAAIENRVQTWAAVPRLAYRLSVLVSLTLLIAGSWLYQQPRHSPAATTISAEQNAEGLVEGGTSAAQDDLLLAMADRKQ